MNSTSVGVYEGALLFAICLKMKTYGSRNQGRLCDNDSRNGSSTEEKETLKEVRTIVEKNLHKAIIVLTESWQFVGIIN